MPAQQCTAVEWRLVDDLESPITGDVSAFEIGEPEGPEHAVLVATLPMMDSRRDASVLELDEKGKRLVRCWNDRSHVIDILE